MKRQRFICLLCILLMALSLTDSVAQGLFPSFSNIFTQLPSLSAIVKRRADSEEKLADGRRQVTYNNITSQDFDSFSKYIAEYGCEMVDYSSDALHFTATIRYKDAEFVFDYDFNQYKAVITYPTNANEEKVELATPTPEPTRKPQHRPTHPPQPRQKHPPDGRRLHRPNAQQPARPLPLSAYRLSFLPVDGAPGKRSVPNASASNSKSRTCIRAKRSMILMSLPTPATNSASRTAQKTFRTWKRKSDRMKNCIQA